MDYFRRIGRFPSRSHLRRQPSLFPTAIDILRPNPSPKAAIGILLFKRPYLSPKTATDIPLSKRQNPLRNAPIDLKTHLPKLTFSNSSSKQQPLPPPHKKGRPLSLPLLSFIPD